MPCYKIQITGSVFKNGFRYFLKAKASLYGITGKVYYTNDSSVEVVASGKEEQLKKFINDCTDGNQLFHITNTKVVEIASQDFTNFEVEDEETNDKWNKTIVLKH